MNKLQDYPKKFNNLMHKSNPYNKKQCLSLKTNKRTIVNQPHYQQKLSNYNPDFKNKKISFRT